jgi:hypothetical protein
LAISKKWHFVTPPPTFARNQNMGNIMENKNWQNKWMGNMVMGKCEDSQRKSYIKQVVNILKEDTESTSLNKPIP